MQIVIDIDEDEYQSIIRHYEHFPRDLSRYERRIIDGIPLSENHGDLIDRNELLKQPIDKANYPSNYVRIAKTIVGGTK